MEKELNITECPTCGSNKIKKVKENWSSESEGKKYSIPLLEYYKCPNCGEKVYGKEAMRRIQENSPGIKNKMRKKAA
jgi:YgiT-type zinc finger domain-containing protein